MSEWQRLDRRVVWVDLVRALLGLTPTVVAIGVFGVEPRLPDLWPAVVVGVFGAGGAVADLLRWLRTRYRVTPERVEVRSGLLVTTVRDVPRDRVRSVDASARLLQRLAGLRKVSVGVGGGEPALVLDAVSVATAERLRRALPAGPAADPDPGPEQGRTLARFAWPWLAHNLFGIWVYLAAAGVLWGVFGLLAAFGLRPMAHLRAAAETLGPVWTVVVAVAVVSAVGVATMALWFLGENWNFRLARVDGSLRTTQGLLRTREVNRDVGRVRGAGITEPLLWRWLGTADTSLVTTGLAVWSMRPAAAILLRGPVGTARRVVAEVLGGPLLEAPLATHPRAARGRRIGWAVLVTAAATVAGALWWTWLAGLLALPVTLGAGVVAYRALGHTVVDGHLVVRSGLVSRRTVALRGRAVVGWQVRQSVLQRRLGLATLTAATAAGDGRYEAIDLPASAVVAVAEATTPGLLLPFTTPGPATTPHDPGVPHAVRTA
jgi:putative membrane protein